MTNVNANNIRHRLYSDVGCCLFLTLPNTATSDLAIKFPTRPRSGSSESDTINILEQKVENNKQLSYMRSSLYVYVFSKLEIFTARCRHVRSEVLLLECRLSVCNVGGLWSHTLR